MAPPVILLRYSISSAGVAQDSASIFKRYRPIRIYQAGYTSGPVVVHLPDAESSTGFNPRGYEFTLAWQRNDQDAIQHKVYQLAYYDYGNTSLGKSVNLSYLLEPTYRLSGDPASRED